MFSFINIVKIVLLYVESCYNLLALVEIAQLEERKDFDRKAGRKLVRSDSVPLYFSALPCRLYTSSHSGIYRHND